MANHGHVIKPHLFEQARDALSNKVVATGKRQEARVINDVNDDDWDRIITAMHDVVQGEHGTARRAGRGADYQFAGKTGTAQVIGIAQNEEYDAEDLPEELRDHALFIAFAPVESPTIAVAIVVENGGSGSSGAAPIARMLFDHYLEEESPARG